MLEFGWQTWLCLGGGFLFLILEVLFPSGGLLGIGAAVCLTFGGWYTIQEAGLGGLLHYTVLVVLGAPVALLLAFKVLPMTPMGRVLILTPPDPGHSSGTESGLKALVGQRGVAVTPLRPAGIALLADRRVDVVTRGIHLENGDPIQVVMVEGNRVIVERARDASPAGEEFPTS